MLGGASWMHQRFLLWHREPPFVKASWLLASKACYTMEISSGVEIPIYRGVAQLVALLIWDQEVGRSSLSTPTMLDWQRGNVAVLKTDAKARVLRGFDSLIQRHKQGGGR